LGIGARVQDRLTESSRSLNDVCMKSVFGMPERSWLGSQVGDHLMLFRIHQINRVDSHSHSDSNINIIVAITITVTTINGLP